MPVFGNILNRWNTGSGRMMIVSEKYPWGREKFQKIFWFLKWQILHKGTLIFSEFFLTVDIFSFTIFHPQTPCFTDLITFETSIHGRKKSISVCTFPFPLKCSRGHFHLVRVMSMCFLYLEMGQGSYSLTRLNGFCGRRQARFGWLESNGLSNYIRSYNWLPALSHAKPNDKLGNKVQTYY